MTTKSPESVSSKLTLAGLTYYTIGAGLCFFCLDYFGNVDLMTAVGRGWKVAVGLWIALVIVALIHPRIKDLARQPVNYAVSCAISFSIVRCVGDTLFNAGAMVLNSLIQGAIIGLVWGLFTGWSGPTFELETPTSEGDIGSN